MRGIEGRIVTLCERVLTTVNEIEHPESESYEPENNARRGALFTLLKSQRIAYQLLQ